MQAHVLRFTIFDAVMRKKPISHLVIAGGGTAGWSTAAILSSLPGLRITVLEPSDIPTIGVGESTLPHIHLAHQKMGFEVFKSADWLDSVDGTIKLTIEFAEFEAKDKLWVHPFFDAYGLDRGWLTDRLLRGLPSDTEQEQASFMFAHTSAGRRRKRGFIENASWFSQAACSKEAAFHMNALAYAKSLKAMTLQRPQVQVLDDAIGAVTKDSDGSIESLILRSGASLTADLYVDCTGSSAMLLHALDEPWVSAHERLFVDGAWLIQLPYRDRHTQLRNTTYCHALSSGWVFNIPLQSRIGTGYIFSSSHQSDDAAAREFALHLQKHYGYEPSSLSFRRLRFATGYRKQQWVKNVIGVGMSSFFCEPLESTAIAMANSTALCLREALQNQHVSVELLRDRLNRSQRQLAQSVLEFVEMHYTLSKRSDSSFWRDYQAKGLTEHQRAWIERYSQAPKGKRFELADIKQVFGEFGMFCNLSYAMMFYGYGIRPAKHRAS